ncbi:glycerol-3-phosphate dehydrogenase [Aestuariivita boseongensis]|uniref:glycerol-3-phosphate dehydrogenase n=1 Tax=Aestuariivita boseongensis TaxID=1470562 RepID=UPI00068248C0|nr:glycerol-3-phosphate dehydrogenase [Aestuariivita boseongensis]
MEAADLFIIGGGINGCGIARDAAGRGLSVILAEQGDLAQATSSASTKLFHGGLRYLEYFEVRLVREALRERETLLKAMPHISWPMRFVLPIHPEMRFDTETPASRLLNTLMPWMRGRRPAWLIRLGLFAYDHLGGREILPGAERYKLDPYGTGKPLKPELKEAFEYSDCWVDDSRLVALNARDAAERGARILTCTKVIRAEHENGIWRITTQTAEGEEQVHHARMLVNAAGPWVGDILRGVIRSNSSETVRLVRGSHIVVNQLYKGEHAYFLQGSDGRIIFAIPYERDFTLIGTTDKDHPDPDTPAFCTDEEAEYLCDFASQYFKHEIRMEDIIWRYSGVRPLYDDGAKSATAATRDYVLSVENPGAPVLHVFGGKITTYRKLAQAALDKIDTALDHKTAPWTAGAPLPGGDFPHDSVREQVKSLMKRHPFLHDDWALRLIRAYGTDAFRMMEGAETQDDLGRMLGYTLCEREVRWLMTHEFARSAEDVVWRRSKLGLHLIDEQIAELDAWMAAERQKGEEGA